MWLEWVLGGFFGYLKNLYLKTVINIRIYIREFKKYSIKVLQWLDNLVVVFVDANDKYKSWRHGRETKTRRFRHRGSVRKLQDALVVRLYTVYLYYMGAYVSFLDMNNTPLPAYGFWDFAYRRLICQMGVMSDMRNGSNYLPKTFTSFILFFIFFF